MADEQSTIAATAAPYSFIAAAKALQAPAWNWTLRMASLLFFAASCYVLELYPFGQPELAVGLIGYTAAVLWRPALVLLFLPLLLTLLNLAPWSGSLLLEEYDIFVLATIGALLARGRYSLDIQLGGIQKTLLMLLSLSYAASLTKVLLQASGVEPTSVFTYDHPINALRVAKGFFWPLLLLPGIAALWQADRKLARASLAWGFALSALSAGLVAIWERGIFLALSEGSPAGAIEALLDFTTRYRITGLFSEMHVGGEYIDGFITLAWPFGAVLAFSSRHPLARMSAVVAHLAIVYAAVATFSRATYLALGLGIAALCLFVLQGWLSRIAERDRAAGLKTVIGNAVALLAASLLFTHGGFISLYSGLATWAIAIFVGRASASRWRFAQQARFLIGAVGASCIAYGMIRSPWVDNSVPVTLLLSVVLASALVMSGVALGARLAVAIDRATLATTVALIAGSLAIITPASLGYRMHARLAASTVDTPKRVEHWRQALALMTPDLPTTLVGMGLGQFPHEYMRHETSAKEGTYSFGSKNGDHYLTLVEGEHFRLTQRVSLPAHSDQTLRLKLRSVSDSFKVRLRVCRRHIIPAQEKDSNCLVHTRDLQDTGGQWQPLTWRFDTGALGDSEVIGRHPLTLEITNLSDCNRRFLPTSILDVDDVTLTGANDGNAVRNGKFNDGSDGWFPISDWSHLRWHIKNTWANIYFDQGWLGLVSLGGFIGLLLASGIRQARSPRVFADTSFSSAGALSLTTFLALSPFGSPLDAPRVALIAYLLMFALAVDLGAKDSREQFL